MARQETLTDDQAEDQHACTDACWRDCDCDRGRYRRCRHRSCYECYLDRLSDHLQCIYCGRWHNPEFDTCFQCRPETRGRDDAARALRQLILWRDDFTCAYCGATEGDLQVDPRLVRPRCPDWCDRDHNHRLRDDDGFRHTRLHVDHIVPCARGGRADEWNLQTLCNVCNIAKGATWYRGCRHDEAKTRLCRRYYLIAPAYFPPADLARFRDDCAAYRATRTWDPDTHYGWRYSHDLALEEAA